MSPIDQDEIIHTENGADRIRECGCREFLDPDWDAWVLSEVCPEHRKSAEQADARLPQLLGLEGDQSIREANGGRRVERIIPKDKKR